MSKTKNPIPDGFRTLTVHVTIDGVADYIEFLKRAFNAVEVSRLPGPGGKVMHAQVRVGDAVKVLVGVEVKVLVAVGVRVAVLV